MRHLVPVCVRPAYTIYFGQDGELTMVHLDLRKWSHHVLADMRRDADALFELHGGPIFAMPVEPFVADLKKHAKLVSAFGFRFLGNVRCLDGETRPVYSKGNIECLLARGLAPPLAASPV